MKDHSDTYYKLPILKWLFVIAVLLSIEAYCNYTSPKNKKTTTELVIIVDQEDKKNDDTETEKKKLREEFKA